MDFSTPQLFHGSSALFEPGTVLRGRGDPYAADWSGADFYEALEAHRPEGCIAHRDAVFMCAWDDLDVCGGNLDVVLEVRPMGPVTRHDMNHSSRISCLIGDGHEVMSADVRDVARLYWSGIPTEDPVWEYIAPSMEILRVAENNLETPCP